MQKYTFASIEARGRVAALWLIISMISDFANLALSAFDLFMLDRIDTLTQAEIDLWDMLNLAGFGTFTIFVITAIIFSYWTYQASANAHTFRKGLPTPPSWAVGWYFIPIANLWKPFGAMQDIWQVSFTREAGSRRPADGVLSGWWAFWIISGITGNISLRLALNAKDVPMFVASGWFGVFSAITGIFCAWYLRKIVLSVSAAQTETHAHRLAAVAEAAAAPTEVAPD